MKWFGRVLLLLLSVPVLALAALYFGSEIILSKKHIPETRAVALSSKPEVIAEGERLAQVMGCFHGCHGADMEGKVFSEQKWVGRFVAPNLTRAMDNYSLTELEAIIRQGVYPEGISVLGMPSEGFSIMTDEDLVAILSFINTYPKQDHSAGESELGILSRYDLLRGEFAPAAVNINSGPWQEGFRNNPDKLGQYLATTVCAECHGQDLQGQDGFTPPLSIAKAYSTEDFQKLMDTGLGLGGRELGLMSLVARFRMKFLKDEEVAALHGYLQSK